MGGVVPSTNVEWASTAYPGKGIEYPRTVGLVHYPPDSQGSVIAVRRAGLSPLVPSYSVTSPQLTSHPKQTIQVSTHCCAHYTTAASEHICLLKTAVEPPLQGNPRPAAWASEERKNTMPTSGAHGPLSGVFLHFKGSLFLFSNRNQSKIWGS